MTIGTCDICEAQNVEIVRSWPMGLETWHCWEECKPKPKPQATEPTRLDPD